MPTLSAGKASSSPSARLGTRRSCAGILPWKDSWRHWLLFGARRMGRWDPCSFSMGRRGCIFAGRNMNRRRQRRPRELYLQIAVCRQPGLRTVRSSVCAAWSRNREFGWHHAHGKEVRGGLELGRRQLADDHRETGWQTVRGARLQRHALGCEGSEQGDRGVKVLVACEWSGTVRDALMMHGIDAVSCDVLPSVIPGPHLQCDVRDVISRPWRAVIAFPDCTHIAVSGALHFAATRADGRQQEAIEFFLQFTRLPCPWPID